MAMNKKCKFCGTGFRTSNPQKVFCCSAHKYKWYRRYGKRAKVKVKGEGEEKAVDDILKVAKRIAANVPTAKPKARKPMAEYNGDAVTEFGNDIRDSNPRVAYVYDGEDQMQFMFSTPEDAVKADRLVDFAMDIMERLVFAAQDGVKVLDKPRTKWPSGKRQANEPQTVNPIPKGGAK